MLSRFSMNVYLHFKSFNCIASLHISYMYSGRLKGERFYFATHPFEIERHWPLLESVLTLKTSLDKKTWMEEHSMDGGVCKMQLISVFWIFCERNPSTLRLSCSEKSNPENRFWRMSRYVYGTKLLNVCMKRPSWESILHFWLPPAMACGT